METAPLVVVEEAPPPPPPKPILLTPRFTPPRTKGTICTYKDVDAVVASCRQSRILAMDFETKGSDYSDPELRIVGLGLAWERGSCYFTWSDLSLRKRDQLLHLLLSHTGLIAHNAYFDGGVLLKYTKQHAQWHACTLAAYMLLSNEGWAGQKWGLKSAQTDILCWEDSNEHELDEWLIVNGYYKGNKRLDNSPGHLSKLARAGELKPLKEEMWRAPEKVLGKYCILDAESCYLLYTKHLEPALDRFSTLQSFFHEEWMPHILLHIDQKMGGIDVDRPGLQARAEMLTASIAEYSRQILAHPRLVPHIADLEAGLLEELEAKEPPRFRKLKERPAPPPEFTKAGKPSKSYENWVKNESKYLPIQSKSWENWLSRYQLAEQGLDPSCRFNIQSGSQLAWLFYERLGYPVRVQTDKGAPGTGIKALKHFEDIGKLFIDRSYDEKELSYIADYIQRTEHRNTIHPGFRLPGTKTGRLSSNGPNLQQIPKSKAVMSLFVARPGHVWVDLDFSALEPMVATEFSEDPNLELLYAPGRPDNDIYLFVGAHIPGLMEGILAAGYDPKKPTKEGISAAKKLCKAERSLCKTVTLACQYGAGIDKVMATLENDDVFLPREEVESIWKGYWNLFSELKRFGFRLKDQLEKNGGWVLNGTGRPVCVTEDYRHDVLNRFIQSTGHDILVKYCRVYTEELTRRGSGGDLSLLTGMTRALWKSWKTTRKLQ